MTPQRWNPADGPLTESALRARLESLGYRVAKYIYEPGTVFPDHKHEVDKIDAVLSGRFAGRTLDSLSDAELLDLQAECAADADSLRIVEAYLDRRLGADWRNARRRSSQGPRTDMSREEALAVLGLAEGASEEDIKAAHRRLIQRMHPDVGGSADLAARINRAKDVLLGG